MDDVPLPLSIRATTLWVVPMRAAMMCLSVNFTPVTNLHHKDAQSAVLNVTNHPAIAHPVTPETSVRTDQCLARVAAYSIVQAKVTSHIGS